ncbi:MAG: sugar phosphate isomerase/epimerase family protein [Bacillota bacterium]
MELGVRNDCIAGENLSNKMTIIKDMGYDFLELALNKEEISSMESTDIEKYCNIIQKENFPVKQTSMGHFSFFANKSKKNRQTIISHIKQMIEFTEAINGDLILLATKEESENIDSFLKVYQEEFLEAADYAQQKNINLAMEAVGYYKLSLIDELVRALDHPAVGMYYDMGNCIYGGEDPVKQIKKSIDIMTALHIKGTKDISLAQMPLKEIISVINKNNYQGRGCLEIAPDDNSNFHLLKAIKLLKKIGY